MRDSVPTLTIGGFLGAGKTTLVNTLLRQANGRRVVVFVNDFGAINIDHDLVETVEKDRVALSNGCVCCSLNDDLVRSMVEFCENDRPHVFVIEASGVADPKALSSTLDALRAAGQAHLQNRIYVLDAAHFGELDYADTEDLIDHAAASDLVLVNKADLAVSSRIQEIEKLLSRSAPGVRRKVTAQALLSWDEILDQSPRTSVLGVFSGRSGHTEFATASFKGFPPLSENRLTALIGLLQHGCLRAKGFLETDFGTKRLQLVGQHVEVTSIPAEDTEPSRLVLIGWPDRVPTEKVASLLRVDPCG